GSPSPVSLRRVPVSTPGGTFTVKMLSCSTLPAPLHVWQGSVITLPVPWHWPHGRAIWKKPCVSRSSPVPWQVGHCLGPVPGRAPEPRQTSHVLCRGILTFASVPNAASLKLISRL